MLNENQEIIRFCFELEMVECKRRQNQYQDVISALTKAENFDFPDEHSYWEGVCFELLAHFARQFNLLDIAQNYYNKAITIFESHDTKKNIIEKWHCYYA